MKITAQLFILLLITGCAGYRPIVDMQGVDRASYEADLKSCQEYAQQVNVGGEAAGGAVIGAGFGAVLGGIAGAFLGQAGRGAAIGAALGGAQGVAMGAGGAARGQADVIRNCMRGRGYRVLR